ncbi:MAG TPA: hypothetical protein VI980_12235 [Acidimicrobiia bacterium]|nr:hypothetical protein [Acidimicrobiia bacterium]
MSQPPERPGEALPPEEWQRFMYACSHERHSPSTQRAIDGSSYGWIHLFIRSNGEDGDGHPLGDDWLDPGDADPTKLGEYFKRVALRLRNAEAHDYAASLQEHFEAEAEARQLPWPHV